MQVGQRLGEPDRQSPPKGVQGSADRPKTIRRDGHPSEKQWRPGPAQQDSHVGIGVSVDLGGMPGAM